MNWLLLRGLARDQRHWMQFGSIFEERMPGSRVFMLDLPGMGNQNKRLSPLTVPGIVDDLRHRWKQIEHDFGGPWGILAVSLGGMVAMDWCDRYAYDFQKLVLVNSSSGGVSHPLRRLQPPMIAEFLKIAKARSAREKEQTILGFNSNIRSAQDPSIEDAWAQFAEDSPNTVLNIARQIIAGTQYRAPKSLMPRILVLSALQDHLTHPSCSWDLARRFGSSLVFHDTAGHDLPMDAPEWLVDQVRFWMDD
jgi:pimeloyl-[acyl-carrier protein] methyl ester esterase